MMGISIYLTYMAVVEFQVTNQNLNNEAEILDDLAGELTSTLEDAMDLESRGYDIFKKTDGIQSQIKDEVHWCKSLKQCFASEAEDLGVPVERGTDSYQACKDFIDPENLCPSL